jgi:NAD(P)H-hydrate epimerase
MKNFFSSLPSLPDREIWGHKGTYGTAALVCGSLGMSGAAVLSGSAALESGAGLVRLLVPEPIHDTVASSRSEYTVSPLPADRRGRFLRDGLPEIESHLSTCSAFGIGPGIGRSLGLDVMIARLFSFLPVPAVFDADALNSLAYREMFRLPSERKVFRDVPIVPPAGPRILTPHPGEFFRMCGHRVGPDPEERRKAVLRFFQNLEKIYKSERPAIFLVLKGSGTVISDGRRIFVNETGNPGMGTGGAGDVLTGVITALAAQGIPPFDAAVLGVAIHGLAGDLAAEVKGETSLTAGDILEFLPQAFKQCKKPKVLTHRTNRDIPGVSHFCS